jgi:hypothetical protein
MKLKFIEHTRSELTHHGYRWVETRTCLECHQFIEIWETSTPGEQIALEVCPDIDWKLLPHAYFCAEAIIILGGGKVPARGAVLEAKRGGAR